MIRIGVISETHGVLRLEAEEMLAGLEHIFHAGDIADAEIVPRLRRIALRRSLFREFGFRRRDRLETVAARLRPSRPAAGADAPACH